MAGYKVRIHDPENAEYKEIGPLDVSELSEMAKKGQISRDTFYLNAEQKWVPLKNNTKLAAEIFGQEKPGLFKIKEAPSFPSNLKTPESRRNNPTSDFDEAMGGMGAGDQDKPKQEEPQEPALPAGPAQMHITSPGASSDEKSSGVKLTSAQPPLGQPPKPKEPLPQPIPPITAQPQTTFEPVEEAPATLPTISLKPAAAADSKPVTASSEQKDKAPAKPILKVGEATTGELKPSALAHKAHKTSKFGRQIRPRTVYSTPAYVLPLLGMCFVLCIFNILFPYFDSMLDIPGILAAGEYGLLFQYSFMILVLLDFAMGAVLLASQQGVLASVPFVIMLNLGYFAVLFGSWNDIARLLCVGLSCLLVFLGASGADGDARSAPLLTFFAMAGFGALSFMTIFA